MKILKASILITFAFLMNISIYAQGFAFFQVENALTKALIKANGDKAGTIELIVGENIDLKNVPMKYKLLGGCKLDEATPLNNDFTKPQTVKINKNGTEKEWIIAVHQVKGETLPVIIKFGKNNPCTIESDETWGGYGIDYSKNTVARFGNDDNMFFAGIPQGAKKVSYTLTVVGDKPLEGIFDVETSEDGNKWKRLVSYSSGNPVRNNENVTMELPSKAKYIRWVYATREAKQNVNLNNITIE